MAKKPRKNPSKSASELDPIDSQIDQFLEGVPSKLSIHLSDDGLQAILRAIFPATTEHEILSFLAQQGVIHGIAKPVIEKALQTAMDSGKPVRANGFPVG